MYSKTIIVGRLTRSPELKQTPGGVSVCTFSVAVDRPYQKKGADRQVDFYDVVAWRSNGEFVAKHFTKGNPILVEGHMESREYIDKQSNKRRIWELIADKVSFVGGKNDGGSTVAAVAETPTIGEDFAEVADDGTLPF